MPYSIEEGGFSRPLPTDVTLRVPAIYRRRGIIASLFSVIGTWLANRRLDRARRPDLRFPENIPPWLREDIGLPPPPPRIRTWWEDL